MNAMSLEDKVGGQMKGQLLQPSTLTDQTEKMLGIPETTGLYRNVREPHVVRGVAGSGLQIQESEFNLGNELAEAYARYLNQEMLDLLSSPSALRR